MNVYIINKSTVLSDGEIKAVIPALQHQVSYNFAPWWGRSAKLIFGQPASQETWQVLILDRSDQQGALGYHDFTPGGRPISKVFAADDKKFGYDWVITLSHEILEMLADPYINTCEQVNDTQFYAREVCDPCEADKFSYVLKIGTSPSVRVSDFILPAWFWQGHTGPQFTYNHSVTKPLQVLEGGYAYIYTVGKGWSAQDHKGEHYAPEQMPERSRLSMYARERG